MSTYIDVHRIQAIHLGEVHPVGATAKRLGFAREVVIQTEDGRVELTLFADDAAGLRLFMLCPDCSKPKSPDPDAVFPAAADLPTEDQTPTTPLTPSA